MFHVHSSCLVPAGAARGKGVLRDREQGVTLVELLIALALLAFILLGIVPLFLSSVKSNYSGNEYTSINMLARDKLEELQNLPMSSPELAEGAHANDLPAFVADPKSGVPYVSTTPGAVPNPFQRTWQVTTFKLPQTAAVPNVTPFVPTPAAGVGTCPTPTQLGCYDYKQIDVTVVTDPGHLGIGSRRVMVSGYVQNPNFNVAPPTPTSAPIPTPTP
ncbi:MAG TPA: prepilin-type N-terminal cleavage/methylation domain-containing protein [Thermoanaerobaculia bacterium]|nr:prepilin-type N-terminal cleavage/methylation domain-containing protein [Thermoanaerobaculia bacterium]